MKFPFKRFTVWGNSMLPTLKPGQDLLIWCWIFNLKIGDMVVFKKNGRLMVKRVKSVDPESIIVEGDNKEVSTDSRAFGSIYKADVIGKVILKI